MQSEDVSYGSGTADDSQTAFVKIRERLRFRLSKRLSLNRLGRMSSLLHCHLGNAGQGFPVHTDAEREIPNDINVLVIWKGQVRINFDPSTSVSLSPSALSNRSSQSGYCDSSSPDHCLCL